MRQISLQSGDRQSTALVLGTIHPRAIPIRILEDSLEQILDYSERDCSREIGGFLIGGLFESSQSATGQFVEVRHFLPALETRSGAASLRFTHETWSRLHREVEQRFPDEMVVGWHHTHPNFSVFLSAYDLFIHRNFFREPWQIALVVDPQRQEFGFFQWLGGEIVDCGFVCVRE